MLFAAHMRIKPASKSLHLLMRRERILPLVLSLLLAAQPHMALAHAIILESSPATGATVPSGDMQIRLRFNSRIDHARSKITLLSPDGREQTLTPSADSPPDGLIAAAKATGRGQWHLRWQVLSVDGHITHGDIPFTIQ